MGKLPPEFIPVSSIASYGDAPIEERKKKIFHTTLYDDAWRGCQGMLKGRGKVRGERRKDLELNSASTLVNCLLTNS